MTDTTQILNFIDEFLAAHSDWLPDVTVDFALDVRSLVAQAAERKLEVAA